MNIDWQRVNRIIFVCQGNICRSPYAEARARSLGVEAASFGLESDGKSPVNPTALRNASLRDLDLNHHYSKRAEFVNTDARDLLIGMEPYHARQLQKLVKYSGAQVTLLGLWGKQARPYIQDPLGLSDDYFQTCFRFIDAGVDAIVSYLNTSDYARR